MFVCDLGNVCAVALKISGIVPYDCELGADALCSPTDGAIKSGIPLETAWKSWSSSGVRVIAGKSIIAQPCCGRHPLP